METPPHAATDSLLLDYLKVLQAGQEEALVGQSLVLGRLADRLDRIERRLELS